MKFKCPKCDVSFVNHDSRYNIWNCDDCGHKFRGIHADANMFDYYLHLIPFTPWFFSLDQSYDLQCQNGGPNITKCPFCFSFLRGFGGSSKDGIWPTVCSKCCRNLPDDHYLEVKKQENPKSNQDAKAEKNDYKKLMDLINRL